MMAFGGETEPIVPQSVHACPSDGREEAFRQFFPCLLVYVPDFAAKPFTCTVAADTVRPYRVMTGEWHR